MTEPTAAPPTADVAVAPHRVIARMTDHISRLTSEHLMALAALDESQATVADLRAQLAAARRDPAVSHG